MKLGITGLPLSGKTMLFEAITRQVDPGKKGESRIGTIRVPDARINRLSAMYNPKKTTYAQVEYFLPGTLGTDGDAKEGQYWNQVRSCDALIHVIRNFEASQFDPPNPFHDFHKLDQELIFADLVVAEKRLERLNLDIERHRKISENEHKLLLACRETLENEIPLRKKPELAGNPLLRGFTFLSGRPMLTVFNNDEGYFEIPDYPEIVRNESCLAICGRIEHEIARMSGEDAATFLKEYGIAEAAVNRIIRASYDLLGLMSFFTVGEDEVRAWTIHRETSAVDAAEAIHSDIKKGFIRAEVILYQDLMEAGNYVAARKKGTVRLEGKTYTVQNGDIIDFRFNV